MRGVDARYDNPATTHLERLEQWAEHTVAFRFQFRISLVQHRTYTFGNLCPLHVHSHAACTVKGCSVDWRVRGTSVHALFDQSNASCRVELCMA